MKVLRIDVEYMIIPDLKELLERLIKELEKAEQRDLEGCHIWVESNMGGDLKAEYQKISFEDKRQQNNGQD